MPESISLLEQPVYRMDQVDRLLGTPNGAARDWIDGCRRGQSSYGPLIRAGRTGSETVTWGEFVEARRIALEGAIVADPEYSSGRPTIAGRRLRADVIAEAVAAGERRSDVARMWDITPAAVDDAVRFLSVA